MLIWPIRFVAFLAVICGVVLLIVDSPLSTHLPTPINHAVVEAAPLLLVGLAFLIWLAMDRPAIVDLIKASIDRSCFHFVGRRSVDAERPVGDVRRGRGDCNIRLRFGVVDGGKPAQDI